MKQITVSVSVSSDSTNSRFDTARMAMLALLVCTAAISTRSYWLDEVESVCVAILPGVKDAWGHVRADAAANLQVPFYFVFAWAWEKLVGASELGMRAGNGLWFLLSVIVLAQAFKGARLLCWGMSLALLTNPFAWYYLDEARPYAMQLGAAVIVFAALYRLGFWQDEPQTERRWVMVLCLGSLLLAASGLLAMLWLGGYLGATLFSTPKSSLQKLARAHLKWLCPTVALLLALGLYYLWTLSLGARASVGKMDLRTAMFIVYELLGFAGLGPGRLTLRANGLAVLRPWLPLLGVYGIALVSILIPGWRQLAISTSVRTRVCWGVAFGLVAGFILGVGIVVQFRVLGRHCMPFLPLVIAALGAGIAAWLKRRDWMGRLIVMLFLGLSMVSCLGLRFSPRHAKDDYRGAADLALESLARGETVWWNADRQGALIYHLPVREQPGKPPGAIYLMNPGQGFERDLPVPAVVLTSKPDIYDRSGKLTEYLTRAGFQPTANLPAFTIWRAPPR